MSPILGLMFTPPHTPRLSSKLPEVEEQAHPLDSLDECYLTHSALPDLSDAPGTSSSADISSVEDPGISSALAVASESSHCQGDNAPTGLAG